MGKRKSKRQAHFDISVHILTFGSICNVDEWVQGFFGLSNGTLDRTPSTRTGGPKGTNHHLMLPSQCTTGHTGLFHEPIGRVCLAAGCVPGQALLFGQPIGVQKFGAI